ncbi:MAG: Snf7 family protein [Promethearchaeota archaeon]
MGKLGKKLFPRKGEGQEKLVTSVKRYTRTLGLRAKAHQKRAEVSRQNAKIALQRGEKQRAKNYLIQYKNYQTKVDRITNIRAKFERQIEAIEEGSAIAQSGNFMAQMRDELKSIATKASPVKIAEIAEDSEMYVSEIEEAGDILAGDPEIDLGIDVTEELNQLETEMLLDASGTMPTVPTGGEIPQYISDIDLEDEEVQTKAKLEEEIEKLRKELEG